MEPPAGARLHPFDEVPENLVPRWLLDIGANQGDVTEAALRSFPDLSAVCLEPVQSTFSDLEANLSKHADRVHLFRIALSDRTETRDIHLTSFHGANSLEPQAEMHRSLNPFVTEVTTERVECIRLDELAPRLPSQHFDIVKIDVEGHEINVLDGGTQFFRSSVDVVIVEVAMTRDPSIMDQSIFKLFAYFDEAGFSFVNLFDMHPTGRDDVMLAQFDCVFRSKRFAQTPSVRGPRPPEALDAGR